jgi:NAD-dependent SIR2 family protein deacetylase
MRSAPGDDEWKGTIARVAEALRQAEVLLIGAGAGMGVDSGLPDFRGREGFWNAYPPARALGLAFEEIASPETFARDPHLAWGFYGHRLDRYRRTRPHRGYAILLDWARRLRARGGQVAVFTSNVDGAFHAAGFPVAEQELPVVECHGSILRWQCGRPCHQETWPAGTVTVDAQTLRATGDLPTCPRCRAIARPNILMFGDGGWLPDATRRQKGLMLDWLQRCDGRRGVALELGAGAAIPSVRMQCVSVAGRLRGAVRHVRVNPAEEDERHDGALHLASGALDALVAIDRRLSETA